MIGSDSEPTQSHHRARVVGAALVVGAAALLALGIEPILLGGLVESGPLSQPGVGAAAMLETLGLALGAAAGPIWMNRGAIRVKVIAAAFGLAAVNLAVTLCGSTPQVLADRAAAGLLAGLLLGAANLILMHGRRPDRLSGVLLGLSMAPQIAGAYLIPVLLTPRFGAAAGFGLLALGALTAAACAPLLVSKVMTPQAQTHPRLRWTPGLAAFALAIFVQNCGMGAAWNYVERLGHQQGLPPKLIGAGIAASLACQVSTAWLSAWLSWRFPRWTVLLSAVAIQTVFVALAIAGHTPWSWVLGACVFGSVPPAMQPFQVGGMIALDPTRRAAVLTGPIILVGNAVGPFLVSFAVTDQDVSRGLWLAAIMLGASLAPYALAARLSSAEARRCEGDARLAGGAAGPALGA